MDSGTVTTFTDAAAQLLPALVQYAAIANYDRTPEDEAMIRQLRIAAAAVASALMRRRASSRKCRPSRGHLTLRAHHAEQIAVSAI